MVRGRALGGAHEVPRPEHGAAPENRNAAEGEEVPLAPREGRHVRVVAAAPALTPIVKDGPWGKETRFLLVVTTEGRLLGAKQVSWLDKVGGQISPPNSVDTFLSHPFFNLRASSCP